MSFNIQGNILVSIQTVFDNSKDLGFAREQFSLTNSAVTLSNGTGADKAQVQWHSRLSISSASSTTIDLTALEGMYGNVAFSVIKAIYIKLNTETDTYTLEVGNATTNNQKLFLKDNSDVFVLNNAGYLFCQSAKKGWIVDANNKNIKLNNPNATGVTVDVFIIGEGTVT